MSAPQGNRPIYLKFTHRVIHDQVVKEQQNSKIKSSSTPATATQSSIKAWVYNPGELARELARFESGTSSKFHSVLTPAYIVRPAVYRTALWRTQTAASGDCRKAEQNRIGAATQRTISSGNWSDSLAISPKKKSTVTVIV